MMCTKPFQQKVLRFSSVKLWTVMKFLISAEEIVQRKSMSVCCKCWLTGVHHTPLWRSAVLTFSVEISKLKMNPEMEGFQWCQLQTLLIMIMTWLWQMHKFQQKQLMKHYDIQDVCWVHNSWVFGHAETVNKVGADMFECWWETKLGGH